MDKKTMKIVKMVTAYCAIAIAAIFITYSIGVGAGMARQKKTMEDDIFKAVAATRNDTAEMTIGGIVYQITIKY